MITAYENRIERLEREKIEVTEKMANCGKPMRDFDSTLRTALGFLANPYKLWASGRLEDQRAVLKLAFTDHLVYARNEGFRTAKTTPPFNVLGGFSCSENKMARPEGFEPPTTWFVARYSIQLSYGRFVGGRILQFLPYFVNLNIHPVDLSQSYLSLTFNP